MKNTTVLFYLLSVYVLLQFAWWGFHLIQLTEFAYAQTGNGTKRIFMIVGEGMVFLLILIFGIWKIRASVKKELQLSHNQNNFLLSVTHELKTPIASNKLYLQTILKRELDTEKRNDLISKALSENLRLEKMIDNILNASRLENRMLVVHKEDVELSIYLTSLVERFRKSFPEATLIAKIQENVMAQIDPFIFETIVNNLIENALKYSHSDGPITVQLIQQEKLHIRIIDCGPGVAIQEQKDIFKKFYRAGNEEIRSQKGTGLGLFIAVEFTRLHSGQLKYSANQPKGSIFELIL